ncbi:GTP-binding protein 2 [Rhypophila decipiens]
MSSIFTFETAPERVASPWLRPTDTNGTTAPSATLRRSVAPGLLSDYGVTELEPEPQTGPIEYKLHLLLRPRRKYEHTSTPSWISGSTQSRPQPDPRSPNVGSTAVGSSHTSAQTRHDRLVSLTTQLLWRLQQSCQYHANSAAPTNLVIPQLPEESLALNAPVKLERVYPGIEASRGALYEIGVADDGTLVGLTKDELEESLNTLRIMAASLGCGMEMLRMVAVGACEWIEEDTTSSQNPVRRHAKLWVAEALVTPDMRPRDTEQTVTNQFTLAQVTEALPNTKQGPLTTDQLRVTLTGPTTSGKSSLLGTLSTGVLDDARGSSRLNLFKHRHEVNSGTTSSIAQELVGYNDGEVINYSRGNVESWTDIHDSTKSGRLVYLLDTPGRPKFSRTILRSLVGWGPHWTLLCIAADSSLSSSSVSSAQSTSEIPGPDLCPLDLESSHIDMCLRLRVPLVVVITKLDLGTTQGIRNILEKLLPAIRGKRRVPQVLRNPSGEHNPGQLSSANMDQVRKKVLGSIDGNGDLLSVVPIVFTSAVDGRGVGLLHALLQSLPLPPVPTSHDYIGAALNPEQPTCLFHIEDKYSIPASSALVTSNTDQQTDHGTVVAGHLRFGNMSIGDKVLVGPFPSEELPSRDPTPEQDPLSGSYGLSASNPPSSPELTRVSPSNVVSASAIKGEWHTATIVSLRNLRLPVQTLRAGQVGSIGVVFDKPTHLDPREATTAPTPKIRKGMVVAVPSQHMVTTGLSLQAASGLTAVFREPAASSLTVGNIVSVYTASVKTSARVVRISTTNDDENGTELATDDMDDIFKLSEETDLKDVQAVVSTQSIEEKGTEVQLELLSSREWIELGSPIVLLEARDRDRSGLGVIVGKVVEITE